MLPVTPAKRRALETRMKRLGVREGDLVEEFIRGSGSGGQKINKTSVAVLLTHPPSGIQVRCHQGRSQALNRYWARVRLLDRLEERILGEKSALQQKIAKIRRQKRRRSKRAKEKMLQDKKLISKKKVLRRPPAPEGD